MKYELNPAYREHEDFLLHVKEYFAQGDNSIHKARNELKIIADKGADIVVKAFKIPNIINRFAYAYLRGSKAKKSYHNGMKLRALHVNTPEPVGYIEFYEMGLLKESFFLSLYEPYDFLIREPLYEADFPDRDAIIEQFAVFTATLHEKNIYHKDYSAGNTLVQKKSDCTYRFSIVDINRMEFKEIDFETALGNFNKLWADEQTLIKIAKAYAAYRGFDEEKSIEMILKKDKELKEFVLRRRKLKALLKGKK